MIHNNKQETGPFGRGWWGQKDQIGLKRLGRGVSGAMERIECSWGFW